ncbi:MAG: SDR family NAD(P)-dependent oxidoreductase, partial [Deltaproteobacteria bacterium]|nr:SDR family NAD(P)-dependent oxidoreductase [Deltaproteobacteria bacterium]
MDRLKGKVAIVTGGASGIGAATLRRFAAEGASVVCADINDAAGVEIVSKLGADGAKAVFQHCDVSQLADIEATVELAVKTYGGLDVMYNNAAWSGGGYVAQIEPEVW